MEEVLKGEEEDLEIVSINLVFKEGARPVLYQK